MPRSLPSSLGLAMTNVAYKEKVKRSLKLSQKGEEDEPVHSTCQISFYPPKYLTMGFTIPIQEETGSERCHDLPRVAR